ncbi:MAG TPA: esterase [Candidatus Angelobacter sp.]|jgi:polyhydroxybutyrate depolymerase
MARGFRLLILTALLAVSTRVLRAQTVMTWTVDGVQRQALVFMPAPATNAHLLPLVFALHGHYGNMNAAAQAMHLQTFWPGAIIVYPQGLKTPSQVDPNGNGFGWQVSAGQQGLNDRDLKFFDAMLADLRQKFPVDNTRIYATGFSNGAIFSYLLWAERGKTLAAVGIVAGRIDPAEHLTIPRAATIIGGTNDNVLPFAEQQQAIQQARQIDNATGPGQSCGPICTLYPSSSQTPVVTRIHSGGHIYPPWAGAAIVEFFKAHKL